MSKVFIEETTLSAIGNAIREKTGKSDLIAPGVMPDEIRGIETGGGGGGMPEEALTITGNCQHRFANNGWNWFIEEYSNRIKTKDIDTMSQMFTGSNGLKSIPFEIKGLSGSSIALSSMFDSCSNLTEIPKISNVRVSDAQYMFSNCSRLQNIPNDFASWFDWSELANNPYSGFNYTFYGCNSLRSVPMNIFENACPDSEAWASYFYGGFADCFALDELIDLPLPYTKEYQDNLFESFCGYCCHLKDLTFATDNGQPLVRNYANQTIYLNNCVGYGDPGHFISYNSGITEDKWVYDDATYQALKNDPDWYATSYSYSRYNHDSAVRTINSLPDTSAYVSSVGGTNTIIFSGDCGSATDGGAINTLTEEEIAIAAAKGWTISFS